VKNVFEAYQHIDSIEKQAEIGNKPPMIPIVSYIKDIAKKNLPPRILPFHRNQKVLTIGAGESARN
jgi:hypothetical protein